MSLTPCLGVGGVGRREGWNLWLALKTLCDYSEHQISTSSFSALYFKKVCLFERQLERRTTQGVLPLLRAALVGHNDCGGTQLEPGATASPRLPSRCRHWVSGSPSAAFPGASVGAGFELAPTRGAHVTGISTLLWSRLSACPVLETGARSSGQLELQG